MKRGYTITELLVVIAIIAVLAALMFPVFSSTKKEAVKTVCASNMHQIYLAAKLYQDDHDGYPLSLVSAGFKPYYPTVLTCPSSKNISRPDLRPVDYTFTGGISAPWDLEAVEACRLKLGSRTPLVLDLHHAASTLYPQDRTSKVLVVREDGSYEAVLATKGYYGEHPCNEPKPPSWFNF
ncbi:type II secretion system protein [bacterium]|nr:MAG: type II secretion system protein [bacterium]